MYNIVHHELQLVKYLLEIVNKINLVIARGWYDQLNEFLFNKQNDISYTLNIVFFFNINLF